MRPLASRLTGRRAAEHSEAEAGAELRALGGKVGMLGVFLLSAVFDLLFILLWISLHSLAARVLGFAGRLEGMTKDITAILQWIFDVSSLIPILVFVLRDLRAAVKRIWNHR
ncbi:hypothetical protein AB0J80_35870 [Actinoplanes sp. NPDC049548]|uniref:hypothetical protein n=1 Tax=Actinoplanes sp. NPDC049548 TaxID=3155152 RepID=UPI00343D2320